MRLKSNPLRFLYKTATWYYLSNHSKIAAFSFLPYPRTEQANFLAWFPHYPFNAVLQAEKRHKKVILKIKIDQMATLCVWDETENFFYFILILVCILHLKYFRFSSRTLYKFVIVLKHRVMFLYVSNLCIFLLLIVLAFNTFRLGSNIYV